MADIIIGNVKGPQGETGQTGPQGAPGTAATVNVGTVTTTVYGNPAQVTNSGTASAAVLDFVIPQGAPGSEVTDVSSLTVDSITETAASFPVPAVGEVMSVVLGKIVKFFGDTVTALGNKFDKANVYNGLDKTADGFALDARQGKALNDKVSKVGNYEVVLNVTASSGTFTAQNASLYLCIIADGASGAAWICAKKATAAPGLSQIFNNSGSRFSAAVSGDDITITSAQYGAIITAIKLV